MPAADLRRDLPRLPLRLRSRLRGRSAGEIVGLIVKNLRHAADALSSEARALRHADRAFDRRWGTDTAGQISVHDLGLDRAALASSRRYHASTADMLAAPVALLGIDPARTDFIDYGAGKGRVVMLAALMGFRSATGVELSARLCAVARDNIDRFAVRRGEPIAASIVHTDAAAFDPRGREILAYLYNPFDAAVLTRVRHRLEAALAAGTTRVHLVYANPEHAAVFADSPGWRTGPTLPGIATFTNR